MIMGMQTVWVMGNASEITRGVLPESLEGNASYDPIVRHHFQDGLQQILQ
jgi:hypothetical protein